MKTTILIAATLALLPVAARADAYCTEEPSFVLTTRGKGYKLSYPDVQDYADICMPTGKKNTYTCQAGEGRYTLKIEPEGNGLRVTQGDQVDLLTPCK